MSGWRLSLATVEDRFQLKVLCMTRFVPTLETNFDCERFENVFSGEKSEDDEDEGEGKRIKKMMKLGKLIRIHSLNNRSNILSQVLLPSQAHFCLSYDCDKTFEEFLSFVVC